MRGERMELTVRAGVPAVLGLAVVVMGSGVGPGRLGEVRGDSGIPGIDEVGTGGTIAGQEGKDLLHKGKGLSAPANNLTLDQPLSLSGVWPATHRGWFHWSRPGQLLGQWQGPPGGKAGEAH